VPFRRGRSGFKAADWPRNDEAGRDFHHRPALPFDFHTATACICTQTLVWPCLDFLEPRRLKGSQTVGPAAFHDWPEYFPTPRSEVVSCETSQGPDSGVWRRPFDHQWFTVVRCPTPSSCHR